MAPNSIKVLCEIKTGFEFYRKNWKRCIDDDFIWVWVRETATLVFLWKKTFFFLIFCPSSLEHSRNAFLKRPIQQDQLLKICHVVVIVVDVVVVDVDVAVVDVHVDGDETCWGEHCKKFASALLFWLMVWHGHFVSPLVVLINAAFTVHCELLLVCNSFINLLKRSKMV